MKSKQNLSFLISHFSSRAGFTLIELLVVMAIIGVLASLIFLNVGSSLGKARDAQRKNDLKQIQTALELYHSDNGKYPTSDWLYSRSLGFWITGLGQNYIKTMPVDPKNSCPLSAHPATNVNCFTYAYYSSDAWCSLNSNVDGYILTTRLEQYQGSDLSQKPYYKIDGTLCKWIDPPVSGLYTVSNP